MKRIFSLVLVFLFLILNVSCNKNKSSNSNEAREPNGYKSEITSLNSSSYSKMKVNSIKDITDLSDLVIKVEIIANYGSFNVAEILRSNGYTDVGTTSIYTFYDIKVLDVYKGNVKKGDIIKIEVFGGVKEGIYYEDNIGCEELSDSYFYILSLCKNKYEAIPPYHLICGNDGGYLPIKDKKLSLNKNMSENFFINGESEDKVINKIKESLK